MFIVFVRSGVVPRAARSGVAKLSHPPTHIDPPKLQVLNRWHLFQARAGGLTLQWQHAIVKQLVSPLAGAARAIAWPQQPKSQTLVHAQ